MACGGRCRVAPPDEVHSKCLGVNGPCVYYGGERLPLCRDAFVYDERMSAKERAAEVVVRMSGRGFVVEENGGLKIPLEVAHYLQM